MSSTGTERTRSSPGGGPHRTPPATTWSQAGCEELVARSSQAGRTIRPRTGRRRVPILALPPEAASLVRVVVLGVSPPRCQAPGWWGRGHGWMSEIARASGMGPKAIAGFRRPL